MKSYKHSLILLAFILCVGTTAFAAGVNFWVHTDQSNDPNNNSVQLQYVLKSDGGGNVTGNPAGIGWDEKRTGKITSWIVIPANISSFPGAIPGDKFSVQLGTVNSPKIDLFYGLADCPNNTTTINPLGYIVPIFNAQLLPRASGMEPGFAVILRLTVEK
jgi:hypothetical protein